MTGLQLLDEYPKAALVVKQWYLEKMLESLNDDNLPEDFKDYVREQSIENPQIGAIIDTSSRTLLDVFDGHKVYIQISVWEGPKFSWFIRDEPSDAKMYDGRKDAEKEAIEYGFKILNEKL
jgi:hypothetical protein